MKKLFSIVLILMLALQLAGCETLQRKFTRKKKRVPIRPRFYQEDMDETRSNLELYMMHYLYWKTWHDDLIVNAGDNAKRDTMACDEVIENLLDMRKRLAEEKAKELNVYIEQLGKITNRIKKGGLTVTQKGQIKQRLSNIKARIARKFYYKKIRDYIKPD